MSIGEEIYDSRTLCQFKIIDQGKMGRGVMYLGKYKNEDSKELDEKHVITEGKKICYFVGDVYINIKHRVSTDSDTETDERINIIKSDTRYKQVMESWKKDYVIEYSNGTIITPKANTPQEVENVAFLVNTAKLEKCNCIIGCSSKSYECFWKATKTIRPGDILTGFYSEKYYKNLKKLKKLKKLAKKKAKEMKRKAPSEEDEEIIMAKKKRKTNIILDSDSEEDVAPKPKKKKPKTKRILESDDDEPEEKKVQQVPIPVVSRRNEEKQVLSMEHKHPQGPDRYKKMKQMNWNKYAQHLFDEGYVVVPVLDAQELKEFHNDIVSEMKKFPEYKHPEKKDTVFINSGFGALANASSFHNPAIRSLRLRMMHPAIELLQSLNQIEKTSRFIEQLPDRLSLRRIGTSATTEAWHRDMAANPYADDEVMGGWLNLDTNEDQFFSGVPRTHKDKKGKSGFAKLSEKDKEKAEERKQKITIPPGHWFCFYQNMIHEVVSRKMKHNSLRLYTGFRLSKHKMALFSSQNKALQDSKDFQEGYPNGYSTETMLETQGVPPLPSGQRAPAFAKMNMIFPKQRATIQEWSLKTFKPICVHPKTVAGQHYQFVDRFMKSLAEYHLPLYPEYSDYEKEILYPRNAWSLPFYGSFKQSG